MVPEKEIPIIPVLHVLASFQPLHLAKPEVEFFKGLARNFETAKHLDVRGQHEKSFVGQSSREGPQARVVTSQFADAGDHHYGALGQ